MQTGLSLIELLIALALGLILTLGVVQVFLGSSQTYRLSDSLGKTQENIRFTLGTLQYDARMAGHFGCLIGEPFNQLDETDDDYDEISYGGGAIIGWEAGDTGLGEEFEITSLTAGTGSWSNGSGDAIPDQIEDQMLPGTDFFIVNSGERSPVELDINPSAAANTLGTTGNVDIDQDTILLVIAGDCSGGDLFQKTNQSGDTLTKGSGNAPGNKTPVNEKFNGDYDDDASIYLFKSAAYFIGEGASGEPALFRERLDAGDTSGAVELAEGVENMQILYGVASGVEAAADSYVTAENVTNWDNVVSVRMALLYRTGDFITDVAEAREFNLAGTEITTQSDRRSRVVGMSTVGIRNRLE
ncbi:PilW family protein [Marinobacter confluentis]|nr:PilW family protein [Marinobacter confluentis]